MTPKQPTQCVECQKIDSLLWHASDNGDGQVCQDCYEKCGKRQLNSPETKDNEENVKHDSTNIEKELPKEEAATATTSATVAAAIESKTSMSTAEEKRLRKSTRFTRSAKVKSSNVGPTTTKPSNNGGSGSNATNSKAQPKGRNRRSLFKKIPMKTPVMQATTRVVDNVFYKGSYMQVGDIVSLVDQEDNVYYAQIRGLLIDDYCEKSAFLTWLIPTQSSPDPKDGFDPATYLIGPDEELSRKLQYLEFVMHAPSNYFLDRTTPYPLPDIMDHEANRGGGYIWTILPQYRRGKSV